MQLARNPSPKRAGQTVLRPLGVGHLYLPSLPRPPPLRYALPLHSAHLPLPFPPFSPLPLPWPTAPSFPLSQLPERNVRRRTVDSDREVTTSDSLQQVSQAGLQQDSQ